MFRSRSLTLSLLLLVACSSMPKPEANASAAEEQQSQEPAPSADLQDRHLVLDLVAADERIDFKDLRVDVGPAPVHARLPNSIVLSMEGEDGSTLLEMDIPDPRFIRAYGDPGGSVDPVVRVDAARASLGVPLVPRTTRIVLRDDKGEPIASLDAGERIYVACKQDLVGACRQFVE
ncbi:MAG: hypothetical protein U1E65_16055 [Myxococcota bacterium]